MSVSTTYYAREDSGTAQNNAVNVQGSTVYSIQFTGANWNNLTLNHVPDGPDAGTTPDFDPDTQIIINNITYNFAVLSAGTLPVASVPLALQGKVVYVIKIDFDRDGDLEGRGDLQLFFTTDPAGTSLNMAGIGNGALTLIDPTAIPPTVLVCFCTGTDIATPSGPRKIETLIAGEMVLTDSGEARQIMWVGRTRVSSEALRHNSDLRPIVIPADAMGPGLPATDLHVSPQHRIVLQDPTCELLFSTDTVLVPAKFLVGTLAKVAPVAGAVDYFHVLLEDHDMLISNGLPTESFQPARRTIDVMDDAARTTLEGLIAVLGAEEMLTRKDRFLSLKRPEARVLLDRLARNVPPVDTEEAAPKRRVLTH